MRSRTAGCAPPARRACANVRSSFATPSATRSSPPSRLVDSPCRRSSVAPFSSRRRLPVPGMGSLAVHAVGDRDYPLVLAIVMLSSALVVIGAARRRPGRRRGRPAAASCLTPLPVHSSRSPTPHRPHWHPGRPVDSPPLLRSDIPAAVAAVTLVVIALAAILAPWVAPFDPAQTFDVAARAQPPIFGALARHGPA